MNDEIDKDLLALERSHADAHPLWCRYVTLEINRDTHRLVHTMSGFFDGWRIASEYYSIGNRVRRIFGRKEIYTHSALLFEDLDEKLDAEWKRLTEQSSQ